MRAAALLLAAPLLLSGCREGKLNITLDPPSQAALDPLQDARLAKFSIRVIQGSQTTDQDAFRGSEAELLVGEVPTGSPFDLRLAGKSAGDDMLGLGLVLDIEADGSGETSISVKFRKPVGYIGGGTAVQALNAAGEAGSIELAGVPVPSATDLAATPTGVLLLAVSGSSLVPIPTADHRPLPAAALEEAGTCVAVSPDSRNAVVCHAASVSVVPLDLIGSTEVRGRKVSVEGGKPTRVAFGAERRKAWVLLDGMAREQACPAAASTVVQLDIIDGRELRRVKLDRAVADLAVDPRDNELLLTLPCEAGGAHLGYLQGSTVNPGAVTAGAQDVVVTDRGIVSLGAPPGSDPVKVQAQIFDLAKPGLSPPQQRDYTLPPLGVAFSSVGATSGAFAWLSEARQASISKFAVAPDGRRAVALFRAKYKSDITFGSCLFTADADADGYLLLDLASSTLLLQRYTRLAFQSCSANCLADMSTQTGCQNKLRALMQQEKLLLQPEFVPTGASLLFGGS